MKKSKYLIILTLIIIWTSFNFNLIGPIQAKYRTLESNGFITEQVYFTSRIDLLFDYDSFEEVVDYANTNYNSFIIVAKFNRKNIGIITKNYEWAPPILAFDKHIDFSIENKNSKVIISPGLDNDILNLSQITFSNLLFNELTSNDGTSANCDLYSNVKLGNNSMLGDPTNVIDAYYVIKQILFSITFVVLLTFTIRSDLKENYRELSIYRLLGISIRKTDKRYIIHLFNLLVLTWVFSFFLVIVTESKLFLIQELRSAVLSTTIIPILLIVMITILVRQILKYHLNNSYISKLLERSNYD